MMQVDRARPAPRAADLHGDLAPPAPASWRDHLPGILVATAATMAAGYLSDHYGAPLTLMALLIGLALNFLGADARLAPGLGFTARTLLRLGIVLVGARVTLGQVLHLGPVALVAIVVILAATLLSGIALGRLLGVGTGFGTLAGGAVAICGASAAMALATTLGEKRASQAQLALVLVGISAASAAAMALYPALAHHLGFGDLQAGFLMGAAVHDVAQSLGAGYSFSTGAGEVAAIVKLTRVALLAPVMAIVALFVPRDERGGSGTSPLPWFVIGFFVLAGVNSAGLIPVAAGRSAQALATALLAAAVTATGIRAPMPALLSSGPRPLLAILGASLVALVLAALAAALLL